MAAAADATVVAVAIAAPLPWARAGLRNHLVYEVHVTNLSRDTVELIEVKIQTGWQRNTVTLDRAHLDNAWMRRPGVDESSTPPRVIAGGLRAIVLVNLPLDAVPASVSHALRFRDTQSAEFTVAVPPSAVRVEPPLLLGPPLRGGPWVAANALGSRGHHRRSFLASEGRIVVPQRFAVDWMRLGPEGALHRPGNESNRSYYGYGADVLAVAVATVEETRDGQPDRAPFAASKEPPLGIDAAAGNFVTLRLDARRWAIYGHLAPGSVRVKKGQRVLPGQVLGRLGSSGTSDLPHLHFHVMDRPQPLGGDGVPYAIDQFQVEGNVGSIESMLAGKGIVEPPRRKPDLRARELPENRDVVRFRW